MRKRGVSLVALVIAVMLVVSACGSNNGDSGASDADLKMRVGMVCGGMTPLLTQIGVNDGSFTAAGLDVEKVCFNSGADAIQALLGGSIDANLGSYEHVLRQLKNGLDVKAYGEIYNGVGYALVVKQDASFESLTDLKGEVLAVTRVGSLSDTGLRTGLEAEGLNAETDVSIINAGSGSTMLAAIESNQAAGGMVSEPTVSQMVATGDYRVLYDPPFSYAGIVVMAKTEWVENNQEAMKTFLRVNSEVKDRAEQNPEDAVQSMKVDFEQIPEEVLLTAIQNLLAKVPDGLVLSEEGAKMVVGTQIELGAIDEEIPYEDTVDLSYLP